MGVKGLMEALIPIVYSLIKIPLNVVVAKLQQLDLGGFLYNVDMEGSSLLHMAVESGVVKVC